MSKRPYKQNLSYVTADGFKCPLHKVQIIDIESDTEGRDVVTVKFNNKVFKSFITNN